VEVLVPGKSWLDALVTLAHRSSEGIGEFKGSDAPSFAVGELLAGGLDSIPVERVLVNFFLEVFLSNDLGILAKAIFSESMLIALSKEFSLLHFLVILKLAQIRVELVRLASCLSLLLKKLRVVEPPLLPLKLGLKQFRIHGPLILISQALNLLLLGFRYLSNPISLRGFAFSFVEKLLQFVHVALALQVLNYIMYLLNNLIVFDGILGGELEVVLESIGLTEDIAPLLKVEEFEEIDTLQVGHYEFADLLVADLDLQELGV